MNISYLFFVTLMVFLYQPDMYGASNSEDEWLDPDPLSKINRKRDMKPVMKEPRNPSQETEDCMKMEEMSAIKQELKLCNNSLNNCSIQLHDLKHNLSLSLHSKETRPSESMHKEECAQVNLYMKRFINMFLKACKLKEDMPQHLDMPLYIAVTIEQLRVLQKFGKGSPDVTLQELDHVMSSVLSSSKPNIFSEEYIPWSTLTDILKSKEALMVLVLGCLTVFLVWMVVNGYSVCHLTILCLASLIIISYSLTYYRMYKQAEIQQYVVMKTMVDIPVGCRPPSELTWYQHIISIFSYSHDECQKYYETIMLDPLLKVSPTLVFSEMIAGFFLHPVGMLGSAIADYSRNILGGLPFGTNFFVLFGSFLLIPLIIIVLCGGVVKVPFLEVSGKIPRERRLEGPQKIQVTEQLQQSSGCSVLNQTAISNLMQTADSADTGLVIMNVTGARRLLSAGGTTVVHREVMEELRQSSTDKKCTCCASEQNHQSGSDCATPASCCDESRSGSRHAVWEDKTVNCGSGCHVKPLRKNRTEELQCRRRVAACMSEVENSQMQRAEVVKEHGKGMQQKDGTEELAPADTDAVTDNGAASMVDSCKVRESDVEGKVKRLRKSSSDVSDEETGFVKL